MRATLELKIIVYVILFALFIIGFQRYYLSITMHDEFARAKQSKNALLIDTVTPIVTLNMALGLNAANKEYLDEIASKNSDIKHMEMLDTDDNVIYTFIRYPATLDPDKRTQLNFCSREITDPYSKNRIGSIAIDFFEHDLQKMQKGYRDMALFTLIISLIAMILFLLLLKQEFKRLKQLSEDVLSYNPAEREFPVKPSDMHDEVGIIQNAVIKMVDRINRYAHELDETNRLLEEKVRSRTRELEIVNQQLERLSTTDTLTGLPNRRHFEHRYAQIWEIAKRSKLSVSVILCDIDHFKKINDTYGHPVGDIVLKKVAEILRGALKRSTDFTARFGGEEFIIILPDADEAHAREFCEIIQRQMQKLSIAIDEQTALDAITFSFGITSVVPTEDLMPKHVIKQADDALYQAKENGRNTVFVYKGPICL